MWRELAGPVYPAMAGIGCTALWQPEALIEILGVAVIPEERCAPRGPDPDVTRRPRPARRSACG